MKVRKAKIVNPPQKQRRPGQERKMKPVPVTDLELPLVNKLKGKVLLITGGDSGIGKAICILFAKHGASVSLIYLNETADAKDTKRAIEEEGQTCLLLKGDISKEAFCKRAIERTISFFGKVDILINNAAIQFETKNPSKWNVKNLKKTFEVNIFSMFYMVKYCVNFLKSGSVIINTSSVTAYRGSEYLIDYGATKGAIVSFTRSLASNLVKKGIRVNGVAPGPVWTPLIVSSFSKKRVSEHGSKVPMERPGQPSEIAPCFLFLATQDSSYVTGQFIHPNGGEIING